MYLHPTVSMLLCFTCMYFIHVRVPGSNDAISHGGHHDIIYDMDAYSCSDDSDTIYNDFDRTIILNSQRHRDFNITYYHSSCVTTCYNFDRTIFLGLTQV